MSTTEIVYITRRLLCLRAPSPNGLIYHRPHTRRWETTRCGIVHEHRGEAITTGMRRDTADLIADPCRICWPRKAGKP